MIIEAGAADRPGDPALTAESVIARLTAPPPPEARVSYWAGRDGDRIVGTGLLALVDGENAHIAVTEVTVRPGCRRRGHGTALLREVAAAATAAGRATVLIQDLGADGPGRAWADALGFAVVQSTAQQTLDLSGADPSAWPSGCAAGYRLARWAGAVPDELLVSFAAAKDAMQDAPMGEITFQVPTWTPARLRAAEENFRASGAALLVVAAISQQAEVAGLTELEVRRARPEIAVQRDTVVLSGHRGHGLGLAMKAENLRWLRADYPKIRLVRTTTATDNQHMLRVNRSLGFVVDRATQTREASLAELTARLGTPGSRRGA